MESSRNFIEKNFKCEICDMNFSTKMFMELPEISNAILVKNPSLHLEVCSIISRHSMTVREITNVILVENYSLNQEIWRSTSKQFMKEKEITNAILAKNPSLNQEYMKIQKMYYNIIFVSSCLTLKYFLSINPPNHLLVEPRYYHSDGSKITLLPWLW